MALDLWSVINSQQRQWIGQQQNLAKIDWCSWDLCFRQIQLIVNDMMLGSALGLVGVINSQQILALICSFPVVFLFLRLISHFFSFHSVGCFRCHALRRPATYLCLCANLFHLSRVALVICFPPLPTKSHVDNSHASSARAAFGLISGENMYASCLAYYEGHKPIVNN